MSETKCGLSTIYTLTPTHCGTGQAAGAIDLPIAREKHTRLPVLPASTLKGVARSAFETSPASNHVRRLFGPEISASGTEEDHHAGLLVFCEAKLLAFPVRSLQRPYLFATCPLMVERLERDLRVFGFGELSAQLRLPTGDSLQVADPTLANQPLVIEDLVYAKHEVQAANEVQALAKLLSSWLPNEEAPTRKRFESSLVLLPDRDFTALIDRAAPVQARIKLTGGKTTDVWKNDDGTEESGNLWYEEVLPSDCFFVAFVTHRRQQSQGSSGRGDGATWRDFWEGAPVLRSVQLGGSETIGYGRCWWNLVTEGTAP